MPCPGLAFGDVDLNDVREKCKPGPAFHSTWVTPPPSSSVGAQGLCVWNGFVWGGSLSGLASEPSSPASMRSSRGSWPASICKDISVLDYDCKTRRAERHESSLLTTSTNSEWHCGHCKPCSSRCHSFSHWWQKTSSLRCPV